MLSRNFYTFKKEASDSDSTTQVITCVYDCWSCMADTLQDSVELTEKNAPPESFISGLFARVIKQLYPIVSENLLPSSFILYVKKIIYRDRRKHFCSTCNRFPRRFGRCWEHWTHCWRLCRAARGFWWWKRWLPWAALEPAPEQPCIVSKFCSNRGTFFSSPWKSLSIVRKDVYDYVLELLQPQIERKVNMLSRTDQRRERSCGAYNLYGPLHHCSSHNESWNRC